MFYVNNEAEGKQPKNTDFTNFFKTIQSLFSQQTNIMRYLEE